MKSDGRRRRLEALRSRLSTERSTFISHWRDLGDFILPTRPRFNRTEGNKGTKRFGSIIDSSGTLAARTLRSGMQSGITSPARPWFRLGIPGFESEEVTPVMLWLHEVTERMRIVLMQSNFYKVTPILYGDLGVFAIGCVFCEEDFQSTIRFTSIPVGSFMVASNSRGIVDTFMREYRMTVQQMVDKWGIVEDGKVVNGDEIFSKNVMQAWERPENRQSWIDIVHAVVPNDRYEYGSPDPKKQRYLSVYYESGGATQHSVSHAFSPGGLDDNKVISERGFELFPVLVPRWEVTGDDVYGTNCPGMTALGDIKQLQMAEKRIAQAIEKTVNPPMVAPTMMRNTKASILPGDVTYVDTRDAQNGFRPAHEVRAPIGEIEAKNEQIRRRIARAFYEDLFLMMAQSDRREITAREIDERSEEKLIALGPVLEQLNQDFLDPVIDITFHFMLRQGLIPEPPEEIAGANLRVEYVSIMAQAQKALGMGGIERVAGFVGQMAQFAPEVLDKLDHDQMVDIYGDMASLPPGIVRSDEAVEMIRMQRAQQQAQQQQMAEAREGAAAAKDLAGADLDGNNALAALMGGAGAEA